MWSFTTEKRYSQVGIFFHTENFEKDSWRKNWPDIFTAAAVVDVRWFSIEQDRPFKDYDIFQFNGNFL